MRVARLTFEQNNHVMTLDGWHNIADGAQLILDVCQGVHRFVSGARIHADGWATVVKGSQCSKAKDWGLHWFALDWMKKYEAGQVVHVRPPTSWESGRRPVLVQN